jgi:hypothetical protein
MMILGYDAHVTDHLQKRTLVRSAGSLLQVSEMPPMALVHRAPQSPEDLEIP